MKKLLDSEVQSFHVLKGPAVAMQRNLNTMAERYEIIIHAANVTSNGDAVIIAERRHREKTS